MGPHQYQGPSRLATGGYYRSHVNGATSMEIELIKMVFCKDAYGVLIVITLLKHNII